MARRKNIKKIERKIIYILILLLFSVITYYFANTQVQQINNSNEISQVSFDLSSIPEYSNEPYVIINNNKPLFTKEDENINPIEQYGDLDYLGRCTKAFAKVGIDTMPTKERESISSIKPSGWKSVKYDIVDGKYLYNRCHLIGYQLTAENANKENLITGTRYLNVEGMLPFENQVAEYIRKTKNHVLYRVTPIFENENLVASGVNIEAQSIEDNGNGICFNVYVYNVQPGIEIDYKTGISSLKNNE